MAKVSTAAGPRLARRLDARATPTAIVFHRGKELGRAVGFHPASWFEEMLEHEFPAAG